jgi:hypothetical protein
MMNALLLQYARYILIILIKDQLGGELIITHYYIEGGVGMNILVTGGAGFIGSHTCIA